MTATEQQILATLIELETAVAKIKTVPKPDLLSIFHRLDELTGSLPRNTDGELLHYLHKRSYEKARLWLQGRDSENARGGCDAHSKS